MAAAQAMLRGDGGRRPARSVRISKPLHHGGQSLGSLPVCTSLQLGCQSLIMPAKWSAAIHTPRFRSLHSIAGSRIEGAAPLQGWTVAPPPAGRASPQRLRKQRRGRRANAAGSASRHILYAQPRSDPASRCSTMDIFINMAIFRHPSFSRTPMYGVKLSMQRLHRHMA